MTRTVRHTPHPTFAPGLCVIEHGRCEFSGLPTYWARYTADDWEGPTFSMVCPFAAAMAALVGAVRVMEYRR